MTFEIATAENTAKITLNDNLGRAPIEQWAIAADVKAVAYAVISYAKKHEALGVVPADVGYAVVWPEQKGEA